MFAVALYLPCRYLWPLHASYYVDWMNHEWMIGYSGAYFRANGSFPEAFNTTDVSGLAHPTFYGNLFYPLLGLPAAVLAPGIVIRLAAVGIFVAQYRLVSAALVRLDAPPYFARIVACLVLWATYPLTNFYNRAAITEFFATGLLVCALSTLVLLCHADDARKRRFYASAAMFCLTLAAGTHPITAMWGVPVFVALAPVFWWMLRDDKPRRLATVKSLAPWIPIALVCVLPWFLVSTQYSNDLLMRAWRDVVFLRWDTWNVRFYPIPYDPGVTPGARLADISTPYLDAQISLSLLLMFLVIGVVAFTARRQARAPMIVFALAAGMFVYFMWLSLSPTGYRMFPAIAAMTQFAYRMVTYVNFSLLVGVFITLMALRRIAGFEVTRRLRHPTVMACAIAAFLLAGAGVIVKWGHIAAVKEHRSSRHLVLDEAEREKLLVLPDTWYSTYSYTTNKLFAAAVDPADDDKVMGQNFQLDADRRFGKPKAMYLKLPAATWVRTNVLTFPWSQMAIDGQWLAPSDHKAQWGKIVVFVPEGAHKIQTRYRGPLWWRILRPISLVLVFGWCIFLIALPVGARVRRLRR
jgi:hypothetical protein